MKTYKQLVEETEKSRILFNLRIAPTHHFPEKHLNNPDPEIRAAAKKAHDEIMSRRSANSWMDDDKRDLDRRKGTGVRYTGD